jgi:hypothetical protein
MLADAVLIIGCPLFGHNPGCLFNKQNMIIIILEVNHLRMESQYEKTADTDYLGAVTLTT